MSLKIYNSDFGSYKQAYELNWKKCIQNWWILFKESKLNLKNNFLVSGAKSGLLIIVTRNGMKFLKFNHLLDTHKISVNRSKIIEHKPVHPNWQSFEEHKPEKKAERISR